jgi:hypothetical protein
MFCASCGKENAQGAKFCVSCGTKLEAQPQEPGQPMQAAQQHAEPWSRPYAQAYAPQPVKKRNVPAIALGILSVVLAAGLILSMLGVFGAAGGAAASKGFAAPEEAINYFVGCLKNGDYSGALAACGINETAKGFDYKTYVERIRTLLPVATSYMPSEYEPYVEFNSAKLTQQMLMQMTSFIISFNLPEEYAGMLDGQTVMIEGEKLPGGLIAALDPAKISGLELISMGKARMHDDEKNREIQKKMAKTFGADDEQFRTVLYKYDGSYYMGGFTLLEYGGRWYINSMTDPLSGIPAYGTPIKISGEEEFEGMLE